MSTSRTIWMVILAAVSAAALYAQTVIANGFDFQEFIKFVNSEAIIAALGFLRAAVGKK